MFQKVDDVYPYSKAYKRALDILKKFLKKDKKKKHRMRPRWV